MELKDLKISLNEAAHSKVAPSCQSSQVNQQTSNINILSKISSSVVVMEPAIIVHGGCFTIPKSLKIPYLEGTTTAAKTGYETLKNGGSAVDAVCAAVTALEDLPQFNAGTGSCITRKGTIEMDAMVMSGNNIKTGAVCNVQHIKNPVQLARLVMDKSSHCLISGQGAEEFAQSVGMKLLEDPSVLLTEAAKLKSVLCEDTSFEDHVLAQHNKCYDAKTIEDIDDMTTEIAKKRSKVDAIPGIDAHDTVGAVAIDAEGNIACATSTGGIPGQLVGRVGDSPIVGCGGYANEFGGCSSTGHGEAMMRATTCRQAVFYMEGGDGSSVAAKKAIDYTFDKTQGLCGIICIDKSGKVGYSFRGHKMAWASIDSNGLKFGIDQNDIRSSLDEIK